MNDLIYMVLIFLAGLVLGALFFGGLWFTVKKVVTSKAPSVWVFGSLIFRVSITLLGFYFIGAGNWQRLLICALGFFTARFIVIYLTKSIKGKQSAVSKEANHET